MADLHEIWPNDAEWLSRVLAVNHFLNPRSRTTNGLETCDIAIFQFVKITVVRHIGFLKLQFYRLRTSETFCINVPHFVEIGHTVAESALGGLRVKEKKMDDRA